MILFDEKYLEHIDIPDNLTVAKEIFARWHNATDLHSERKHDHNFLKEFFETILGYKNQTGGDDNTLLWQTGSYDAKKPDGILQLNAENIKVVIELKDDTVKLNKNQKRKEFWGTPIEQGFMYASKMRGKCEWVIVSNFREILLFRSNDESRFCKFLLSELATDDTKIAEFCYVFKNGNLFTEQKNRSKIHDLIEKREADKKALQDSFYADYKQKRTSLKEHLIATNIDKPELKNNHHLYFADKLLRRILFISYCEERGLIPENTLANEIESARGHKYNKLKDLFLDVDKGGNKIPAFNGGLFKKDDDLDSLTIDDQQIDSCLIAIAKTTLQKKPGVEIFGHIFEQSITDLEQEANPEMFVLQEGQVKKDGVVYTPEPITKFIVASTLGAWLVEQRDKAGGDEDKYKQILSKVKVIDPACGSGAFLIAVFDFLVKEWQKFDEYDMHNHILQNNIFGVDINPISVEIAKLSLWLKTVDFKEKLANLDNQIKVGNSLVDDPNYAGGWDDQSGRVVYGTFKSQISFDETQKTKSFAFDWSQEFLPYLKDGGFDIVVGNPPYVRQELFSDVKPYLGFKNKQKQMRYEVFSGQADLYCYFYEKGLDLLKNGGKLGFITSNKWMRAKYGENLRKYLLSGYKIEKLIDLGGQKIFETVTVDTNIMVVKKAFSFHDYRISVGNNLEELTDFNPKYLNEKNFNINLGYDSNEIKTKMEKLGTPLKNWNVRINRGILTGFNEAFIIDTKTRDELVKQDPVSDEIIKPILRGRDIDRYGYEWAGLWLINSHNGYLSGLTSQPAGEVGGTTGGGSDEGNKKTLPDFAKQNTALPQEEGLNGLPTLRGSLISAINVEKKYPAVFKHLQKYQTQCQKRADQGNHWTNLRSCAYIDDFLKQKLYIQKQQIRHLLF